MAWGWVSDLGVKLSVKFVLSICSSPLPVVALLRLLDKGDSCVVDVCVRLCANVCGLLMCRVLRGVWIGVSI